LPRVAVRLDGSQVSPADLKAMGMNVTALCATIELRMAMGSMNSTV
jgi:hypothetical protein